MRPVIHATAIVEPGVAIGDGTTVWDNVHIRAPARIGRDSIIGEKTYVAYGVEVGDRVKVNAFVYICTGTTVEDGVMISAGAIFTNDRLPRATHPDLAQLRPSEPDKWNLSTVVREGATIGAGSVIGPGIVVGRWAMVGMGSVVTHDVPDFHLVIGSPARTVGCVCRCGQPFVRDVGGVLTDHSRLECPACPLAYSIRMGKVVELSPPVRFSP